MVNHVKIKPNQQTNKELIVIGQKYISLQKQFPNRLIFMRLLIIALFSTQTFAQSQKRTKFGMIKTMKRHIPFMTIKLLRNRFSTAKKTHFL